MPPLTDTELCRRIHSRLARVDLTWIAVNDMEMYNLDKLHELIEEHAKRKLRLGYSTRRQVREALLMRRAFKLEPRLAR